MKRLNGVKTVDCPSSPLNISNPRKRHTHRRFSTIEPDNAKKSH